MHTHQNSGVAPLPKNVTRLLSDNNEAHPSVPETTSVRPKIVKAAGYVLVSTGIYIILSMVAFSELFKPGNVQRWKATVGLLFQLLFQIFWGLIFQLICPQLPDTQVIFALEVLALINCGLTPLILAIISMTPNAAETGVPVRSGRRNFILKLDLLYRIHMFCTGVLLLMILLCYFASATSSPGQTVMP